MAGGAIKFLTPDGKPGVVTRLFSIPAFLLESFNGALMELESEENWEPFGTVDVETCVQAAINTIGGANSMIGTILCTLGDTPEFGLPMDGSTYSRFDYPELWNLLPEEFKDDISFSLPDLTDVFLMGSSVVGIVGGEAQHTLTIEEIPPHSHGEHTHLPAQASGEIPTPVPDLPIPDLSTSRGGGLPHNNLPPYYTVRYFIVAR